jgi:hypothetical protein
MNIGYESVIPSLFCYDISQVQNVLLELRAKITPIDQTHFQKIHYGSLIYDHKWDGNLKCLGQSISLNTYF